MTLQSLYRRPLPEALVAFASDEGRLLFREALATGHMEGFFALSEQFHTQADPSFCGLGSLVVALNALAIDPGRLWKGPWRWFSEELLDCCAPLEKVREKGIPIDELACLAQCNGAEAKILRGSIDELRRDVIAAVRSPNEPVVIAGYSRKTLGQTGDGHYSPIGGYHPGRDLVLLLDVARFKYPPHWVSLSTLHAAMQLPDSETGRPRGWVVLRRRTKASAIVYSLSTKAGIDDLVRTWTTDLPNTIDGATNAAEALERLARALEHAGAALEVREAAIEEHRHAAHRMQVALRASKTFAFTQSEAATALALAAPPETWRKLTPDVLAELTGILEGDRSNDVLAPEIARLSDQLTAIEKFASRAC